MEAAAAAAPSEAGGRDWTASDSDAGSVWDGEDADPERTAMLAGDTWRLYLERHRVDRPAFHSLLSTCTRDAACAVALAKENVTAATRTATDAAGRETMALQTLRAVQASARLLSLQSTTASVLLDASADRAVLADTAAVLTHRADALEPLVDGAGARAAAAEDTAARQGARVWRDVLLTQTTLTAKATADAGTFTRLFLTASPDSRDAMQMVAERAITDAVSAETVFAALAREAAAAGVRLDLAGGQLPAPPPRALLHLPNPADVVWAARPPGRPRPSAPAGEPAPAAMPPPAVRRRGRPSRTPAHAPVPAPAALPPETHS